MSLSHLEQIQDRANRKISNPEITQDFPTLFVWRDVAISVLFYKYF